MALTVATIEAAIEKILTTGQNASLDGMSYSAGDLGTLRQMRLDLKAEDDRTTRPTMTAASGLSYEYMRTMEASSPPWTMAPPPGVME